MNKVLLGIGSNIEPERNLQNAAQVLKTMFHDIQFSTVYGSKAVGIENASDFLNACCLLKCHKDYDLLRQKLKQVEEQYGRVHDQKGWQSRTLDLDIILFNGQLKNDDLHKYRHVWVPACELLSLEGDMPKEPTLYASTLVLQV
ncbi:MAG: 2-amino-4-hydroxy-6-hydroxymethyldihydropteridine diphosphokinase [Mariprofundaceae bacterium]|nr:2-amino-4-hydroxy-6-hydroxymethyldihydropteridine diphosphokinase [Mariprofundaceae bacterium]